MSHRPHAVQQRLRGRARRGLVLSAVAAAALASGGLASPAAAQRVETLALPSAQGNVDLRLIRLNRETRLKATVLLPDGYDEQPERRWPVLYMLHGIGDNSGTWVDPKYGNLRQRAARLEAIVVMPEGGRSYWVDQWQGGRREGANVRRYVLDEVLPAIESRYRILPGRANHAIGGLSMGGYGAMVIGAELPSYFGAVVSLSGLLDLQTWGAVHLVPYFSNVSFTRIWGRPGGAYQKANSPKALLGNLSRSRLFVSSGSGVVDPTQLLDGARIIAGGAAELGSWADAAAFTKSARARGIPTELKFRQGAHTWLTWRRDIPHVLAWNPFLTPPDTAATPQRPLTFRTMSAHGNAWGLGFRFDTKPVALAEFTRAGQTVSATGAGRVTITPGAADADASGDGSRTDCRFTAELPFSYTLPDGC